MPLLLLACVLGPPLADTDDRARERLELAPPTVVATPTSPTPPSAPQAAAPSEPSQSQPSQPEPSSKPEVEPKHTWQTELFIDTAYGFNSNLPDNHEYRGMATSPRTDEITIGTVGAFIRHPLDDDEPWQFEFGLQAGAAVDARVTTEPTSEYVGAEVFKHVTVANVGFMLRKTKTAFAVGVFESPIGIGAFWTYRNWNYTGSWAGTFAPYYLTGARIVQSLPRNFELSAWVVDSFQTFADRNLVPSGMLGLTWSRPPTPVDAPRTGETALTIASNLYFGPESQPEFGVGPKDWLVYLDLWAIYDFDDHFALGAVWDVGVDRPGRTDERALYSAAALFSRGTVYEGQRSKLDLAVRPEVMWDPNGRFSGLGQWLIAGTATTTLTLFEHVLLRAEYRFDHSTAPEGFFYRHEFTSPDGPGLARDQHTIFLSLSGSWSFWFGGGRGAGA